MDAFRLASTAVTVSTRTIPRKSSGTLRQIWSTYNRSLNSRPLLTNCVTGAALAFFGDVVCQKVVERQDQFSWRRALSVSTFGFFYNGGVCFLVYPLYRRMLPKYFLRTSKLEGVGSTCIDNFIHTPFFYIPSFFVATGILQGQSFDDCMNTCRLGWTSSVLATWVMWLPLQYLNFSVVPPHLRVLVLNCGCFIYNIEIDFITEYFRQKAQIEDNLMLQYWILKLKHVIILKNLKPMGFLPLITPAPHLSLYSPSTVPSVWLLLYLLVTISFTYSFLLNIK